MFLSAGRMDHGGRHAEGDLPEEGQRKAADHHQDRPGRWTHTGKEVQISGVIGLGSLFCTSRHVCLNKITSFTLSIANQSHVCVSLLVSPTVLQLRRRGRKEDFQEVLRENWSKMSPRDKFGLRITLSIVLDSRLLTLVSHLKCALHIKPLKQFWIVLDFDTCSNKVFCNHLFLLSNHFDEKERKIRHTEVTILRVVQ